MIRKLPEQYISGLVDGEGCFALTMRKDVRKERPGNPAYYSWKALFAMVLRSDDIDLLLALKETFGCGSVTLAKAGSVARFQITNIDDLETIIIPFFKKNKLFGKKKNDFALWAEAIMILKKYKEKRNLSKLFEPVVWEGKDEYRIHELHQQMIVFKSNRVNRLWVEQKLGRESKTQGTAP